MLKRLISWVSWLRPAPSPAATFSPPWRKIDRERWKAFLDSESGYRFQALVRAWEASKSILAVRDTKNTVHAAGSAKGYGDCIQDIIGLSWKAIEPERKDQSQPVKSESAQVLDEMTK